MSTERWFVILDGEDTHVDSHPDNLSTCDASKPLELTIDSVERLVARVDAAETRANIAEAQARSKVGADISARVQEAERRAAEAEGDTALLKRWGESMRVPNHDAEAYVALRNEVEARALELASGATGGQEKI